MTIKNDRYIRKVEGLIDPCHEFTNTRAGKKCISYGISSYGYDVRCSDEFKIFTPTSLDYIVDPKNFDEAFLLEVKGPYCIIPPNSFVLTRTVESFKIPRNIMALCVGKSTYARCGVVCNTTPLEPEWEGHITIELSNTTPLPVKIYANEGIAQVMFFEANECCEVSYGDRKGKYMNQQGITLPKV